MEKLISKNLVPSGYSYLHMESHVGEEVFRVKEVTNAAEADKWIMDMSNATKTTWRVSRTYPYTGTVNDYRKDYRCQHHTDRRSSGMWSTKNTDCPASLKIFIKSNQIQNHETDDLLREYPTEVVLRGEHNHELHSAESLRYRDMSVETKNKLSTLYRFGYSPTAALQMLKMDLLFEHPHDYEEVSIDSQFLPTHSVVSKMFRNELECKYGPFDDGKMFMYVEDFLCEINKNSGSISELRKTVDGQHYFLVSISSLMARCHIKMKQCSECVFLDIVYTDNYVIFLFSTTSAVGSLPLGVIITDCAEESVFFEALQCYQSLLSDIAFYSLGYPKIFMTYHDTSVKNILKTVFPNSSLLSNQFHLLKSFWLWLISKNNRIKLHDQDGLYNLFRRILTSSNEDEAEFSAAELISSAKMLDYTNLITYFMPLWEKRKEWVSCFRGKLILSQHNMNDTNCFEIGVSFLKDIIFAQTVSFNLLQLVHFIVTKYELYSKLRIMEYCIGRRVSNSRSFVLRLMQENIDVDSFTVEYDSVNEVFEVSNEFGSFIVDMIRGSCTCKEWSARNRCVHATIVCVSLDSSSSTYNVVDIESKHDMLFVSEGIEVDWAKTDPSSSRNEDREQSQTTLGDKSSPNVELDDCSRQFISSMNYIDKNTIANVQSEFNNFIRRIQNGLSTNPNGFLPALKNMLRNAKSFTANDLGLVSAMCSFGVNTTRSGSSKAMNLFSDETVTCNNQLSIKKNGKHCLTGRKSLSITRPTSFNETPPELNQYDFVESTNLIERKRKANRDESIKVQEETTKNTKKIIEIKSFKIL